jgi:hypothetical protein
VFSGVINKVSDINPKKCEQLVSNLSNHIIVKLYILEIVFQWYKECTKWVAECKVMAKI